MRGRRAAPQPATLLPLPNRMLRCYICYTSPRPEKGQVLACDAEGGVQ